MMAKGAMPVRFADEELEARYHELHSSTHPEDKKLLHKLHSLRASVQRGWQRAVRVPDDQIPPVYREMFKVTNLWRLDAGGDEDVLFSRIGDELCIVDFL